MQNAVLKELSPVQQKTMWKYLEFVVKLGLILLFLYQCFCSLEKYQLKTKLIANQVILTEGITYPSVSVCIDNAFKTPLEEKLFYKGSPNFTESIELVEKNRWSKNETFYFVNQASRHSRGYQCMTTKESNDPGKPCRFLEEILRERGKIFTMIALMLALKRGGVIPKSMTKDLEC